MAKENAQTGMAQATETMNTRPGKRGGNSTEQKFPDPHTSTEKFYKKYNNQSFSKSTVVRRERGREKEVEVAIPANDETTHTHTRKQSPHCGHVGMRIHPAATAGPNDGLISPVPPLPLLLEPDWAAAQDPFLAHRRT